MKGIFAIALALGVSLQTGHAVNLRYDANGVKLVKATLDDAVFETDADDAKRWELEIRDQMHYLISQLRFINSTLLACSKSAALPSSVSR